MTTTPRNPRPDVAELRAAYEASTKTEWRVDDENKYQDQLVIPDYFPSGAGWFPIHSQFAQNAKFIATAHNVMPSLLDYIEQLEAERRELTIELNDALQALAYETGETIEPLEIPVATVATSNPSAAGEG